MNVLELALAFSFVALAIAMALCGWMLLRGPAAVDRILAMDTLYICFVALAVLMGIRLDTAHLLEAATLIALLGFVSTVALARYVSRGDVIE